MCRRLVSGYLRLMVSPWTKLNTYIDVFDGVGDIMLLVLAESESIFP